MKTKSNGSRKKLPLVWEKKVARLEEVVVNEFGYSHKNEIWKSPRTTVSCWARWIVWHYMIKWGMTAVMAGRYSGYNHGTVSYGVKNLKKDLAQVFELRQMFTNVANEINE